MIAIITDNPAYPEREAHALATARSFAARGPAFRVAAVDGSDSGQDFLHRLAEAGNGEYVGAGGSFTATILSVLAGV